MDRTASGAAAAISAASACAWSRASPVPASRSQRPIAWRLGGGDPPAGVEQLRRFLLADDCGQRDAQRESLVEAEQREVGGEARFGGGDPEVRGQREAEAAADRGALDGRDDRERLLEQPDREVVQVRAVRTVNRVPVGEVSPGAEHPARAAQHDRPAALAGRELLAGDRDLLDQPDTEEVAGRAVDLQRCHVVVAELDGQLWARGLRFRHQLSLPPRLRPGDIVGRSARRRHSRVLRAEATVGAARGAKWRPETVGVIWLQTLEGGRSTSPRDPGGPGSPGRQLPIGAQRGAPIGN